MRTAIVSAACSLLLLLGSYSAFAQAGRIPGEAARPQVSVNHAPLTAGLFEPQKDQRGSFHFRPDAANQLANPKQTGLNLLRQQDGAFEARDFRGELAELANKGILQQKQAGPCAHIIIFQAPEMDSQMVVNVPPDTGGPITTFKGLGPCCRDIRPSTAQPKLPGLRIFPQRPPLLQRPFVLPPPAQPKD